MFFRTLSLLVTTLSLAPLGLRAQFTSFSHVGTGATGSIVTNGPGSYTLEGGGNDIWSGTDEFDYAHFDATGDFDVRVRVESVEPTARWTKAGLMAREALTVNSRMAFNRVTPPDVPTPSGGNGANDTRYAYRTGTTAPAQGEHEDGTGTPQYPNAWLRLKRTGSVFDAYRSTDGQNWFLQGSQDTATWEGGALPGTVMLGFAVSRHSGPELLATVQFREFGFPNTAIATITRDPASTTVIQGRPATFNFGGIGGFDAPFYTVQWLKNGVVIPDATNAVLTFIANIADSGATYSAIYSNTVTMTTATSGTGTLTVNPDVVAPTLVSANAPAGVATAFTLVYSEPVNEASAETLANYSISGGVMINSATLQPDGVSVLFDITPLNATAGAKVVTVNNVTDLFGNAVAANSSKTIIFAEGRMRYHQFNGIGGTAVSDLTGNARFPDSPDRVVYVTKFENPEEGGNNFADYGAQFLGYLIPPETGDYRFFLASDDSSVLYLSTDENPANKVQLAREPQWAGFREYTGRGPDYGSGVFGRNACTDNLCENVSGFVPLIAGNRYYVEFIYKEGGGGDYGSVTWQLPGGAIPANGSEPIGSAYISPYEVPAAIGAGLPANRTVLQGTTATFTITATGSPLLFVTWYRDGAEVASGNRLFSYTTGVNNLSDNGAQIFAVVSNATSVVTSRVATLTVTADNTPPTALSASSFNGKVIGLCYSEVMGASTATDPVNYTVNGVSPTNVVLRPDGKSVIIDMEVPVTIPFTVVINNVTDFAGNPIAANTTVANGTIWATAHDITPSMGPTAPAPGSTNFTCNVGDADVIAGGADIWGAADEFHFIYNQVVGDFDVKVKVQRLDPSNRWAKGGLMARASLAANSPTIQAYTTPPSAAVAELETGLRIAPGGPDTIGWEFFRPSLPRPNVWVRLRRNGDLFRSYYGTDGVNWAALGERALPGAPAATYLGIATTSHNTTQNTTAEYRNYSSVTYPGCNLTFSQNPQNRTIASNGPVSFSATVAAVNVPGTEINYQWQRSTDGGATFANIAGAVGTSFAIPYATADFDANQFRVLANAPGCSATSTAATLTLTNDVTRPRVKIVLGLVFGTNVAVYFNEPMGDSTADNFSYSIVDATTMNPITITDAQFDAPGGVTNRVRINVSFDPSTPIVVGSSYTLTVTAQDLGGGTFSGAVDLAGNPLDPNPTMVTFTAMNINFNPDAVPTLPTTHRLAPGTLTARGFDGRSVDILPAIPNANGVAEAMLAGVYTGLDGNTFSNDAPIICWHEPNVVNYNNDGGNVGEETGDVQFPGAQPATDNIAIEILLYADLTAGLHRWAVNSDDGFRVSPALGVWDPDNAITLGEFNGGRGAATSEFSFIVPEDGLYPIRLIWEEGQGGMNLEFWSRNLVTNARSLINAAGGVAAYRVPSAAGTLNVVRSGANVVVSWPAAQVGCLEGANSITGPWVAVRATETLTGTTKSIRIPRNQAMEFYRLRRP
jgi:hypothetical protein